MEPFTVERMRDVVSLQGYAWADEDLERIRPLVERGLALVEKLAAVVPQEIEPAIQYRMF